MLRNKKKKKQKIIEMHSLNVKYADKYSHTQKK